MANSMTAAGVRDAWTAKDEAQWKSLCERRIRVRDANKAVVRSLLDGMNAEVCINGTSCGLGDVEAWAETMVQNADALILALSPFSSEAS